MKSNEYAPRGFFKKYIMGRHYVFWLFIACYTLIHLNFEYNYWLTDKRDVFSKYEVAGEQADSLEVAKKVYFTKASWMFALIVMAALGLNFRSALALSFAIYSAGLMLLFPFRSYTFLNLVLALGLLIEQGIEWRESRTGKMR